MGKADGLRKRLDLKVGIGIKKGDEWEIEGELALKDRKVHVLKNEELRIEVI